VWLCAEQPINEAVITVPSYFNQAERRAMSRAADAAGLRVLQLINDNTAGNYNYHYSFISPLYMVAFSLHKGMSIVICTFLFLQQMSWN